MRRRSFALALALAFVFTSSIGCGPSSTPPLPPQSNACSQDAPPADGNAVVLLGRDVDPFQRLADGDQLSIVHGPQGGQHVYVTVRLYSPSAATWSLAFVYRSPQGTELANNAVPVAACAGWTTSAKVRVFLFSAAQATGTLTVTAKLPSSGAAPVADHANVSVE